MTKSSSSRLIALGVRLVALLGTSYFLVATSAPYEPSSVQTCTHANQSMTFHVTGTCGTEGDITVTSQVDDCAIAVQGASSVGLPSAGRFDSKSSQSGAQSVSLSQSSWTLSGYLPEGTLGSTADAGIFTVVRDARASEDLAGTGDSAVFTVMRDTQAAVDLGATADTGGFTVVRDAQVSIDVGAAPSGAGGSSATIGNHGYLVSRTCYRSVDNTSGSLSCYDNSAYSCQATLMPR
jgi:hypothetical protein